MREIVIVVADLYLQPPEDWAAASGPTQAAGPRSASVPRCSEAAPSIEHLARFADPAPVTEGWRAWLARWLALPRYAAAAPASVAAAGLAAVADERAVWFATPLHLVAGPTSLHYDRRSLLRLPRGELDWLATDFRETFRGSGLELHALEGGELLLSGPAVAAPPTTTEPARVLLTSVAEALPRGEGATPLRRLAAEIEMWLHAHALNEQRERRGLPPVSTLWVWGGGARAVPVPSSARELAEVAFGTDAYVQGLWRLAGGQTRPLPVDWAAAAGEPRAERVLAVVEVADLLHAHPRWSLAQALAELDRRIISPSLAALHRGEVDRLALLANDRRLTLRAAHRWRLWRRKRPGLEGLT